MMIISTPYKKSIISLFNDQLIRDSTGVIITIFFLFSTVLPRLYGKHC